MRSLYEIYPATSNQLRLVLPIVTSLKTSQHNFHLELQQHRAMNTCDQETMPGFQSRLLPGVPDHHFAKYLLLHRRVLFSKEFQKRFELFPKISATQTARFCKRENKIEHINSVIRLLLQENGQLNLLAIRMMVSIL
mmetsp:Transcript_3673/g.8054  ORF Transcript_3673/g.8054 Transcript_3673/m.8054 type:complete len:137 (+) Transcript_3673:880-1290(+)